MTQAFEIRRIAPEAYPDEIAGLAEILVACVEGGASVHFLTPLALGRAVAFWRELAPAIACGERALWVAYAGGRALGTVQLVLGQPENGAHRAEISKMLVHPDARRLGLGRALMQTAEAAARAEGRTLLVLDTCTGEAGEALYRDVGFTVTGIVPDYARFPDGRLGPATFMHKVLSTAQA